MIIALSIIVGLLVLNAIVDYKAIGTLFHRTNCLKKGMVTLLDPQGPLAGLREGMDQILAHGGTMTIEKLPAQKNN